MAIHVDEAALSDLRNALETAGKDYFKLGTIYEHNKTADAIALGQLHRPFGFSPI